ncbi:MAG: 2-amino-4-hydroxy-6-hydroxymethyldihydropteridine diphosphokinase [Thermoflavifilum sp.]|nr:2-amino-4-hydroxy-6-hydroxymethyldihydropteridine diphosphokinase [Thermoflavifilum sp.]MCL6513225.1 2-amino-4-hydroxy-6-hydroxymethyldihydropteridine diphosphokinase [Alicyclobacillus sp.]
MPDVFIGLGSNLGHRLHHLGWAVECLQKLADGPLVTSAVYETDPVGYTDQPAFLNMVVRMPTRLSPRRLLAELQRLEALHGRTREIRFGPRTLDLDILLYGTEYVCFADLQIPHPRMWERAFVLVPLADVAPDLPGPGGWTVAEWAARAKKGGGVRDVGRFW